MQDDAFIVVFPAQFSKPKLGQLIENIKKILRIKEQEFQFVKKENDVIVVRANDPVFASSAINQLFGIEKIAIARKTQNDLKSIVNEIVKLGGNLLLRGEKFLVKVEGDAQGFVPKDVEIAATSSIIEHKSKLGAMPGSENKYDKLLYTYITKKSAFVCIFLDQGHNGLPNNSQQQETICPIFDEISALSCIETLRQGFDVKIIIIYRKKSELAKIAKMLNRIIPFTLKSNIKLEFYNFDSKQKISNQYEFLNSIVQLCKFVAEDSKVKRISLPISNKLLPINFTDQILEFVFSSKLIPHFPIEGLEDKMKSMAREFVLEKYLGKINIQKNPEFSRVSQAQFKNNASNAIKNRQRISIKIGPNNLHDILDSIE